MKELIRLFALTAVAACATAIHAAIITVNTTNNVSPGPGETNLFYAISLANTNGDTSNTIKFNIPGAGPHYLKTPTNGYPLITHHNITIDGYSQPGSAPNSNSILAPNNAKLKIVLDSRIDPTSTAFLGTDMNYAPGAGNTGFGAGDVGMLGLFRATNFHAQGLCFLGQFSANYDMFCVAIACDLQGTSHHSHISGCWFGVDLDGTNVVGGCVQAIDNARHRDNPATQQATSDFMTVGVKAGSANPRAEFNVMLGMIETIGIEGNNARISGNFLGVFPDGLHDYIGPRDGPDIGDNWRETHIEIGRANNNTVIGSDLDGVNDADERNIIGGVVDQSLWVTATGRPRGYTHVIEFYGNNNVINGTNYGPGTNIVVAGNYFGVGIDGRTRFTIGVPALDGTSPQVRFESNVVFNNYPTNIFDPTLAATRGFFDGIGTANIISARGNQLVNNYPFPTHPQKSGGFLTNYYNKALAVPTDANSDVFPVLSTNTTLLKLVGKVPIANTNYPTTIIDLYIPDPEGITNGMAAMDPDLPDGWVQGLTYLGSFVEGSTNDLNPAAGQFEFDISKLDLKGATRLTITANYSKSPATTPNAVMLTSPFSDPYTIPPFIPGGVASVGLTQVVPDMPVWYSSAQLPGHPFPGYVTNGPVDTAAQVSVTSQANGNWEPYISVVGDSTFLIGAGMFADDGSWAGSTNLMGSRPNQRYIVTLQPAAGGAPKIGEVFYDDFGQPYRLHTMMRQRNPGVRVAGDKRSGATTFMTGGTAALLYGKFWFGIDYFNTDGRYSTNFPLYGTGFGSVNNQDGKDNPPGTTDFQSVSVQTFSLNPATLDQVPLSKAFDSTYGLSWRSHTPTEFCNALLLPCGDGGTGSDNQAYFGGELAALDNGNFVAVVDDYTGFFATNRVGLASAVATILGPNGSVVKDTWLVDPREIWSNVAAYSGGFCVRVQTTLYFYDNAGNLKATNTVASSGVGYDTGRGDGTRIASDIRSHYVYLAGPTAVPGGAGCSLGIWDARTGAFVTNAIVSETDPGLTAVDRVGLAVDGLDRVCVAYATKPDKTPFTQFQIAARVMKFDGANVSFLTHSFFPFISHDSDPAKVLGYATSNPNVAMTTRQICIAAKGTVNGANNPAGGPTTSVETTVYAVINHPDPKPTPFAGVPGEQLFDDPSGGWTYVLDGSSAIAGAANSGFTSLDGTWSHDNGSDTWDGSAIGGTFVAGSNAPGGVSSIDGYLRVEDSGDPRPAFPDPGNRKIYFGHNISAEGASATVLNDGVTLHFRARIPTAGLLDDRFITAQTNYPAGGDGYLIHDGGKGNFGIKQASGGIVSFSLTTAADTGTSAGLLMNSRNGTAVSGTVDSGDGGTTNILALDPTRWHEFWITIRADTTAQGTHRVDVYLDGSLTPSTFYVTAGDGSDFTGISYIAMGCGATGQSGAFDVDYFTYKLGAVAPASSAVPLFTSGSLVSGNIVGLWAGGHPPYTVEAKSALTNAEWMDLVTFTNTSAQTPAAGPSAFFRVANRVVFNVSLSGANERTNQVTTSASGGGTLTLDGNKLTVDVSYANLSASLTGVHFHGPATAEENASVIINLQSLNTGTTSGTVKGSVTMTAQQVRWLLNGLLYMNIHTGNNPGGEIRGQIPAAQKLQFVARLNGANERPTPITTSGQGAATLVLDNNQLKLNLNYYGLTGAPTMAHIHGPATTEQFTGVLVGIDSLAVNPPLAASGRYSGTLTLTSAQILNLLDGLTYLNIHTGLNGSGEIRGQITP